MCTDEGEKARTWGAAWRGDMEPGRRKEARRSDRLLVSAHLLAQQVKCAELWVMPAMF